MSGSPPDPSGSITVSGITIEWRPDGTCTFDGLPVAMMWVDTTLMGLMSGVQAMVGAERFALALQSEGRKSVEADWQVISRYEDFRDGFTAIAHIAAVAGWGHWRLLALDEGAKTCRFQAVNSWEGRYQQSLGECWGSGMLAGKLAGYCTRLFDTNCWAEQTAWIARGDPCDEFEVSPSQRSIEREIQDLLATDEATRADMAVALQKLQTEIAERRQAERAALESEQRFRELADSLPEAVFETNADGSLAFVNRRAFEEFGYTEKEFAAGLSAFEMIVPEEREIAAANFARRLRGEPVPSSQEYTALRRDGTTFPCILLSNPIVRDGRPAGLRGILVDIAERRRIEQERLQTQRLRAVGELAAGVSHNLNNILTGILGPADLLRDRSNQPELMRELDTIVASAQRASDLVVRLYRSVAGRDETVHRVEVNRVLLEAVQAARPRWRDEAQARGVHIDVVTELSDVPDVAATDSGLHDIVINLLFNAVDALPEGGTVTITTTGSDDGAELTIIDTGLGMDEEIQGRVFEPFFTTKTEIGTGLGLATVYNTVSGWGGSVSVRSAPGQGSTFAVFLPPWAGEEQARPAPAPASARRARVAVIEDDDTVRGVLGRALAENHAVDTFASGQDALKAFQPGQYDVALVDLGLPQVPGDQVAARMRAIDSHVSLILITGWHLPEDDDRLQHFDLHLRKPFARLGQVRAAVADAIQLRDARAGDC